MGTTLTEIRALQKELQDKMATMGKEALKPHFDKFFEDHPTVEAIRWEQYTPYFNDGDACEFGVNDFVVKMANPAEGSEEDEDDSDDDEDDDGFVYGDSTVAALEKEVRDDDVLEHIFGDHVRVTVTRDGFEVEEYEHD